MLALSLSFTHTNDSVRDDENWNYLLKKSEKIQPEIAYRTHQICRIVAMKYERETTKQSPYFLLNLRKIRCFCDYKYRALQRVSRISLCPKTQNFRARASITKISRCPFRSLRVRIHIRRRTFDVYRARRPISISRLLRIASYRRRNKRREDRLEFHRGEGQGRVSRLILSGGVWKKQSFRRWDQPVELGAVSCVRNWLQSSLDSCFNE